MKKYLLFSVLGIAMLTVSGCSTDQVSQEEETPYIPPSETTTSYTIPGHEVAFEYPDNWSIEEPGEDADEYDLFSVSTPNGNSMDVKYYSEAVIFKVDEQNSPFDMWFYDQYRLQEDLYESYYWEIDFQGASLTYFPENKGLVYCDDQEMGDYLISYPMTDTEEDMNFRTFSENFCTQVYNIAWYHKLDTSDWKTYTNEEYGFSMKIPQDNVPREREVKDIEDLKASIEFVEERVMDAPDGVGYLAYVVSVYEGEYESLENFLAKVDPYESDLELYFDHSIDGYEIQRTKPGRKGGVVFYIFSNKKVYALYAVNYGGFDEIAWTVNSVIDTFTLLP